MGEVREGLPMADGVGGRDWRDGGMGCLMCCAVLAMCGLCVWLLAAGCVMRLKAHALKAETDAAELAQAGR